MTIPKAGNDGFSGAINDARIFRNFDLAVLADSGDDSA
jgi:hypothetical protein